MWTPTDELAYIEWDGARAQTVTRPVIAETPWVVYLNGRELLTLMCTPTRLHALVLGFLLAEGMITALEDVWQIKVFLDEDRVYLLFPEAGINEERPLPACAEAVGSIQVWLRREVALPQRRVLTSGCGGGTTFDDLSAERAPLAATVRVSASQITRLMRELNQNATVYRQSRGVHTSALSDGEQLLLIAEDVGRHNTIDKLRGEALLRNLSTRGRILLTSGRISSEMLTKARAMETPIVVSRTSPTATSVRLAQRWNMTLIGYARAPQLRVYAGAERIEFV